MKPIELFEWLELRDDVIVVGVDGIGFHFKVLGLPWYEGNALRVNFDVLDGIDVNELAAILHRGKEVEQITRVTGYFSKVASWNRGKLGELHSRKVNGFNVGGSCGVTCDPLVGFCRNDELKKKVMG
jgi:hypothetical protein